MGQLVQIPACLLLIFYGSELSVMAHDNTIVYLAHNQNADRKITLKAIHGNFAQEK